MQKDSTLKTLTVAAALCIFCSILVSGAAVGLKERQDENKKLDIKKNLLLASGLITNPKATKEEIETTYQQISAEVINLDTGTPKNDIHPETFDQKKASKDPKMNKMIDGRKDLAGIKMRSQFSTVYKVVKNEQIEMFILPINGKGLWSTLYGFIALAPDTTTIKGIGFYQHGETPGLGGEIDNPLWKAQWIGKKAFDDDFMVSIKVLKSSVPAGDPEADFKVDGLSGATITSNGVTGLVRYWLGPDGFGPYLDIYREQNSESEVSTTSEEDSNE